MRALPMLEERRHAFETCVYCPKLCRSACPVSNAEPRETLIPWGKMSSAYFAARGDVALEESFAKPAWACTGCYACRESCDHRNDVAGSLLDARDAFVANGLGPAASKRVLDRFSSPASTKGALLVGCQYDRKLPDVARAAASAAKKLFGDVTTIEKACCGLPLRLAGDKKRFEEHARQFAGRHMIAVDPGCAMSLRAAGARVTMLVERAAERVAELREASPSLGPREMRWHDPCQLGRGLGIYDAPRVVLTRVLGRAPLEFAMRRERAECSGAGGLLPLTMPENSRAIASKRIADADGAEIVTACASSVLRFRSAGARTTDIVTLIDAAL
jgi:Fe-S oxidoreductase